MFTRLPKLTALITAATLGTCGALIVTANLSEAEAAYSPLSAEQVVPPGAYVIDLGQPTQTIANALRPYGLVYDLIVNRQIPVYWAIAEGKQSDAIADFVMVSAEYPTGKTYTGGSFIIPSEYAAEAATTIANWTKSGVVVDGPSTEPATVPLYDRITAWPRVVLDAKNGKIAQTFYANAGIPATAYRWADPAQPFATAPADPQAAPGLTTCDDLYVMPHADPTYATHKSLLPFISSGAFLWAGCHAVSVLENLDDPTTPENPHDFAFLSTAGLVPFGKHGNGAPPYSYGDWSHPLLQLVGTLDAATLNGSEQVYLPALGSAWRPQTQVLVWNPTQANIQPGKGHLSDGAAAILVTGRAFGDPNQGMVMYEAGHDIAKLGDKPAGVAAQRTFLDFNLLAGLDRSPKIAATAPGEVPSGGQANLSSSSLGTGALRYEWTSNCGGFFSAPTSENTTWTAPQTATGLTCTLRVRVTDPCGRANFDAIAMAVEPPPPSEISKKAFANGEPSELVAPGDVITYVISPSSENWVNPSANVVLTDTMTGDQYYQDGSLRSAGAGFDLGAPADGSKLTNSWIATWDAAANTPSATSGQARFLYGQNSQYGSTWIPDNSFAYAAAKGGGYTPFIVTNRAGDRIVAAINTASPTNALGVTCTDLSTGTTCSSSTIKFDDTRYTLGWGNPVVLGARVYFMVGDSPTQPDKIYVACLDFANAGGVTSAPPTPCAGATKPLQVADSDGHFPKAATVAASTQMAAGLWSDGERVYAIVDQGTDGQGLTLTCALTSATGAPTACPGFGNKGLDVGTKTLVPDLNNKEGLRVYAESVVVAADGSVFFSTITDGTPPQFGVYCVTIAGSTLLDCATGAPVAGGNVTTLPGATNLLTDVRADARALRPVVSAGEVIGVCYGPYQASAPLGCATSRVNPGYVEAIGILPGPMPSLPEVGDPSHQFIVTNKAGETLVSSIATGTKTDTVAVACVNTAQGNSNCSPAAPIKMQSTGTTTIGAVTPVVIGTRVYFVTVDNPAKPAKGYLGCLDYANTVPVQCAGKGNNPMQIVTTKNPAPSGSVSVAGAWTHEGNIFTLGENGGLTLGCIRPGTPSPNMVGATCAGYSNNGNPLVPVPKALTGDPKITQIFPTSVLPLAGGNVLIATVTDSAKPQYGLYCVQISGALITNCDGTGGPGNLKNLLVDSGQGWSVFTDARALVAVQDETGATTGGCFGPFGAAGPTGCLNTVAAQHTFDTQVYYSVPMAPDGTRNGMSAIAIPGTARVVYATGSDSLQCFDYALNAPCGETTSQAGNAYGATALRGSSCLISYGANNAVPWQVWDASDGLGPAGAGCETLAPTFSFVDPAPRYCAPDTAVADWADLVIMANSAIPTGAVVTYLDSETLAPITAAVVDGAMGGDTTTVTVPKPDALDYAQHRNVTVVLNSAGLAAGSSYTAYLDNSTTSGSRPQVCYEAQVGETCAVSVGNAVSAANAEPTFQGSGFVGLNCALPPELEIVKVPSPHQVDQVGQVIEYRFTVTNTGTSRAYNIEVTDAQVAPANQANLSPIDCGGVTELGPSESLDCLATYTVSQADLDFGVINDLATVIGSDPWGGPITPAESSAVVRADQRPELVVTKTTPTESFATAGTPVPFTFTITNSGNQTLYGVTLADLQVGPAASEHLRDVNCVIELAGGEGDQIGFAVADLPSDFAAGEEPVGYPTSSAVLLDPTAAPFAPGTIAACEATYVTSSADYSTGQIADFAIAKGYLAPEFEPTDLEGDLVFSNLEYVLVPSFDTSLPSPLPMAGVLDSPAFFGDSSTPLRLLGGAILLLSLLGFAYHWRTDPARKIQ